MNNQTTIFNDSLFIALSQLLQYLNPIQDVGEGAAKRPTTSFSHVTSTNLGLGPKNFLTFSFKPFATLVQNFKFVPSASP